MIVDQFLRWIANAPAAARADATDALARAYLYTDLEPIERTQVEAALIVILDDASPIVRKCLAEALSASPDAPRGVILPLLNDLPEIASVVLSRSPILLDGELIDAVAQGNGCIHETVAARVRVSTAVAAALSEVGNESACIKLLNNPGAQIASISISRIAERFGDNPIVREILFAREDLTVAQRQYLLTKLSDALLNMGLVRHSLPQNKTKSILRDACDKATLSFSKELSDRDIVALVEHLRISSQLTPSLVLRASITGNMRFLAAVLASLSETTLARVEGLLLEGRDAALFALFQKAGLPNGAAPALLASVRVWRETSREVDVVEPAEFARRMLERILTFYNDFDDKERGQLLTLLRRFAADAMRDSARAYAASCRQAA
jgi:uncharacterized protein (DUF2336 family)